MPGNLQDYKEGSSAHRAQLRVVGAPREAAQGERGLHRLARDGQLQRRAGRQHTPQPALQPQDLNELFRQMLLSFNT